MYIYAGVLTEESFKKKFASFGSALLVLAFLAAYGDDDSDFATRPSNTVSPKSNSSSEYKRVQCDVKTDRNCVKD